MNSSGGKGYRTPHEQTDAESVHVRVAEVEEVVAPADETAPVGT